LSRRAIEPGSPGEAIVAEERALLGRVLTLLGRPRAGRVALDLEADLLELRDEVAEAKPEDVAPLVEHMTRVAALAAGRTAARAPVDAASPYFAHLRLREGDKARDVLIGRRDR
jgi:DNA helicase-2/ATP-dependent DNA helicase PcrA